MRTTIDGAGRVVVPKGIRDLLQLNAGSAIDIEAHDGLIEIRPAPAEVVIVDTPDGPVAAMEEVLSPLTDDIVRATLERVRR
jgi:AbrB family looped-hinge helix DNA binding protein